MSHDLNTVMPWPTTASGLSRRASASARVARSHRGGGHRHGSVDPLARVHRADQGDWASSTWGAWRDPAGGGVMKRARPGEACTVRSDASRGRRALPRALGRARLARRGRGHERRFARGATCPTAAGGARPVLIRRIPTLDEPIYLSLADPALGDLSIVPIDDRTSAEATNRNSDARPRICATGHRHRLLTRRHQVAGRVLSHAQTPARGHPMSVVLAPHRRLA